MNDSELIALEAIVKNHLPSKPIGYAISTLLEKRYIASSLLNVNCYAITKEGRRAAKEELRKKRRGPFKTKRQSEERYRVMRERYFYRQKLILEINKALES